MDQELAALAEAGAAVLVSSMATDLWQSAKEAALAVFRRLGRGRQLTVEAQLDNNAAMVQEAVRPEEVRQALFAFWTLELAAVLRQDPAARAELVRMVAGFDAGRREPALEQNNTARDSGSVYAVQHGDLRVYPQANDQT
ncbi:hypothetical protein ACFU7Y_11615 [Kitasatospora sp. NPDC057542]|uniref:hypothetical protein n=1 Tax=Kitasatospora sp. NPDC057542 TaxID=3346162 RepID=UPI00368A0164